MGEILQLHPCYRCGGPSKEVTLENVGVEVGHFRGCDGCLSKTSDELARVRPVFEAMIAAGVPRDLANDVMTSLLQRLYP